MLPTTEAWISCSGDQTLVDQRRLDPVAGLDIVRGQAVAGLVHVGRVAHPELHAGEGGGVVADLGGFAGVGRQHRVDRQRVDHLAVDAARAGGDGVAADGAGIDRSVLVAEAQLAQGAADEDPGLACVLRGIGVGLELDRAAIVEAGRVVAAAQDDMDLGVVGEVEPGRQPLLVEVVEGAAMGLEGEEAGQRDVEHLAHPARPSGHILGPLRIRPLSSGSSTASVGRSAGSGARHWATARSSGAGARGRSWRSRIGSR